MAVEAQHMNLFPAQLLTAREMTKPNRAFYNAQIEGAVALPSTLVPFHHTTLCDPNSINNSDSGLTYNIPLPRKRSRDSITESNVPPVSHKIKLSSFDQDLVFHFQNQQSEIDRFIAQHTERVWMELEEQRVRQSRMLVKAIQEAVAKKLKEKDEEIQRVGKLNWVLQERVKSLSVENQIWRELAQNNEATANSLRNNLEQVLAHVSEENRHHGGASTAESSCGSNNRGREEGEEEVCGNRNGNQNGGVSGRRMCNECGVRESIVLLLPCRHLCLCTMDIKFLSPTHNSVDLPPLIPSIPQGPPYDHARLSHSLFTYSFPVTPGPKFLRLFFYSTSYPNFDSSKAFFSVKAGPYTLLQDFDASLHADSQNDRTQSNIFREYCINLQEGEKLNITFIPSTTDSYAFINGIEIVSMPPYLYYTSPDVDINGLPKPAGRMNPFPIENSFALETMYRLRVADQPIPPADDTGMLRRWDVDKIYLTSPSVQSIHFNNTIKLNFTKAPNYTAPDDVYRSLRNMGRSGSMNKEFNLTWQLPVDLGFTYLLMLHFCQLNPEIINPGDLTFYIYIQDRRVEEWADVLSWSDNQRGVPVVRNYTVLMPSNQDKVNLSLKMHPNPKSLCWDAQINAIELFKINYSSGNLAGPNPSPSPKTSEVSNQIPNKNSSGTRRPLILAVAGAVFVFVLLSFIVVFFVIKRKHSVAIDKGSNQKDGISRGVGSSSLPTNLCRHFSIAEIRAATNNFDKLFVVGVGGFGDVYKGYIDDGSTPVAIKRLKPGSQQGLKEFMNEIEMLSQLRHLHLVSLIGYCYEINEMILVYDFMDRGTLRDHLYGTDNPPLSWNQRLQICIGAARGLHYLHTGAKQMIIHRDVKSTNILLDEKWVAKVSDFGLSRIGPTGSSMTHVSTQVKGSIGYMDPEYYKRQRLTEKSDVYSYGVVLLEVLCGRQPLLRMVEKPQVSLVDWTKHWYEKGSLGEIVDPALKGQIAAHCLRKFGEVALSCLVEDGTQRPSMNDVVGVLEFVLQLQLQDSAHVNAVLESGREYEDSGTENMFSSTHSSVHVSDYSNSSGLNSASYGSKQSDRLLPCY